MSVQRERGRVARWFQEDRERPNVTSAVMGLAMELSTKVVLEVATRRPARPEPDLRYITR